MHVPGAEQNETPPGSCGREASGRAMGASVSLPTRSSLVGQLLRPTSGPEPRPGDFAGDARLPRESSGQTRPQVKGRLAPHGAAPAAQSPALGRPPGSADQSEALAGSLQLTPDCSPEPHAGLSPRVPKVGRLGFLPKGRGGVRLAPPSRVTPSPLWRAPAKCVLPLSLWSGDPCPPSQANAAQESQPSRDALTGTVSVPHGGRSVVIRVRLP